MKTGRFFQIPERPRELHELWRRAIQLAPYAVPDWLSWDDFGAYRLLGSVSSAGLSDAERAVLQAEMDELELARLIVDRDPQDPQRHRVYIAGPPREAEWSIGVYQGPSPLELAPAAVAQPVLNSESVTDVAASLVADPFWLRRDGRFHMFFEVMNWKANKGEIGMATSDDGLHWRYKQIVLAEEFHLSYPCVFAADGDIFMVPESFQDNSVRLYRARQFPYEWEHVATLLSGGYYVDSSIFFHADTWWMLTETGEHTDDTLRLFFADRLHGPWQEHPCSPVVRGDATISRPAGRVLLLSDRIIRFAQNCSEQYGADVRAVEIVRLTRTEYEEQPLPGPPQLGPSGSGWNAGGMHHIDAIQRGPGNWLAVVDGWWMEPLD